ncbi:MAG: hypothetical protein DI587_22305 [Variovorax paradoxus]|jgi:hypothetical protein|nr:MAG: hypothetical protein DI583_22305 [Variovorax paradoxus]PZQ06406.1 MAG: hypothetical protein DI587_22305 [Variovorax paradoxus]
MPSHRLFFWIAAFLALTAAAQPAPATFHMVQRIDEMLVGVDAIALDVVDRDHVAGTYFLVHAQRPSPLVGYANYVVDCRTPQRIAILNSVMPSGRLEPEQPFVQPPRRSGRTDLARLVFEPVHTMDGTALVARFSCEASGAPGRAAQIAAELAARGSPPDSRSLYCQMQPDAGQAARRVEVRYSAAENAVAVNGQWLSSGFVAGDEVVFGVGAQWRVDTRKRHARLLRDNGRQLFKGDCDTRPESMPSGR